MTLELNSMSGIKDDLFIRPKWKQCYVTAVCCTFNDSERAGGES